MTKNKLKGSKGPWKLHYGNYGTFATVNDANNKRICTMQVDALNEPLKGNATHDEQYDNMMLIASAKKNYQVLQKLLGIGKKALYQGIVEGKDLDYKNIIGHICDHIEVALKETIDKNKGNRIKTRKRK